MNTPKGQKLTCILLTEEQANRVRGAHGPNNILSPQDLGEGNFAVAAGILDDPAFAEIIPFLITLPQCKVYVTYARPDQPETCSFVPDSTFIPNHASRIYVPRDKPWATPPLPEKGDWSESALYESVGRALTNWERFEHELANLFAAFLSPSLYRLPASRAYGSVISFQARANMVQAAGDAFFLIEPNPQQEADFESILNLARGYSARRNDIAHGVVGQYASPAGRVRGLALLPAEYATSKHEFRKDVDLKRSPGAIATRPKYAYTTAEVRFFSGQFQQLVRPTYRLRSRTSRRFVLSEKKGEPPTQ